MHNFPLMLNFYHAHWIKEKEATEKITKLCSFFRWSSYTYTTHLQKPNTIYPVQVRYNVSFIHMYEKEQLIFSIEKILPYAEEN